MKFNEIIIKTNTFGSEYLSGELIINGITSFDIKDPNDFLQIIEDRSVPFDYYDDDIIPEDTSVVTITVYLTENDQGEERRRFVLEKVEEMKKEPLYGDVSYAFSSTDDKDWANNWKEFFHPLAIGDKLMIKPSWEECNPGDRTVLEIDPESSFGSGRHETTKLCLEQIEKQDMKNKTVLDMGCGSGILGIAASLLGAEKCVFVDIEENAVDITKKNIRINGVDEARTECFVGNVLDDEALVKKVERKYDIIISNIVADVLAEMMPLFKRMLACGGKLILSGIISMRKDTVTNSLLQNGLEVCDIFKENDWICVTAKK